MSKCGQIWERGDFTFNLPENTAVGRQDRKKGDVGMGLESEDDKEGGLCVRTLLLENGISDFFWGMEVLTASGPLTAPMLYSYI